jgi:hypothetical protein
MDFRLGQRKLLCHINLPIRFGCFWKAEKADGSAAVGTRNDLPVAN